MNGNDIVISILVGALVLAETVHRLVLKVSGKVTKFVCEC